MAKYAYEYGKRWHVQTPRAAIKRKATQLHVTDHKVLLDAIDAGFETSKDKAQFTQAIRNECYRYAALCMSENMELYLRVMSGRA